MLQETAQAKSQQREIPIACVQLPSVCMQTISTGRLACPGKDLEQVCGQRHSYTHGAGTAGATAAERDR